jgi:Tol biopolymer transport system component
MFLRFTIIIIFILSMAACAAPPSNIPSGENAPGSDPPASPTPGVYTPTPPIVGASGDLWIAFIGRDSNVWVMNRETGLSEQITFDAAPHRMGSSTEATIVEYWYPRWSSGGRFLAYRQDIGRPHSQGYNYFHQLIVQDMETGQASTVVYHPVIGFAWEPGTHRMAYAPPINESYWQSRGSPNMEAARGIWVYDADTGEQYELVPPERGYTLAMPKWSPDGRYLSFDEVLYMEGRGSFAYYDLTEGTYTSWEEVIGSYTWSAESKTLAYDKLPYLAERNERIWLRDLGDSEQAISPEYKGGYAYNPAFSPDGKYLAYLADLDGIEGMNMTLILVDSRGGNPREIGAFQQVQNLTWAPRGEKLYFFAGHYQDEKVYEVDARDGSVKEIVEGKDADIVVK